MKTNLFLGLILSILFLGSCKKDNDDNSANDALSLKLSSAFAPVKSDTSVYSALLQVRIPDRNLTFKEAYGNSVPGQATLPDDQFFTASIGKTVTSMLIMNLAEENKLNLDSSIAKYLPAELVNGLQIYNGVEYSKAITIRQLLNHTSGLPDFLLAGTPDPNGVSPFFQLLFSNVNKTWTATEIINFHKQNFGGISVPGKSFEYSDTNYQLLGLIIEAVTSKPLHEYAWTKLFQPLGMTHSYYYFHENPRGAVAGRVASLSYISNIPLDFPGMSFDWSAGGMISTADDLVKLLDELTHGSFLTSESKSEMLQTVQVPAGYEYGLGVFVFRFGTGPDDYLIGHEGATNAIAFYTPKYDAYIVATMNQLYTTTDNVNALLNRIMDELKNM